MNALDPADVADDVALSYTALRVRSNCERVMTLCDQLDLCLKQLIEVLRGSQLDR